MKLLFIYSTIHNLSSYKKKSNNVFSARGQHRTKIQIVEPEFGTSGLVSIYDGLNMTLRFSDTPHFDCVMVPFTFILYSMCLCLVLLMWSKTFQPRLTIKLY